MYIVGGYAPSDGLSEFVYYLDMNTLRFNTLKYATGGLETVGKNLHVFQKILTNLSVNTFKVYFGLTNLSNTLVGKFRQISQNRYKRYSDIQVISL